LPLRLVFLCRHGRLAGQPIMGQQLLAGFFLQEPWWRRDVQRRVGHRGLGCTPQLATPPHLPLAGAATTALPTTAAGVRAATTSSAYSATVPAARSIARVPVRLPTWLQCGVGGRLPGSTAG
jgi:hypothetical protein